MIGEDHKYRITIECTVPRRLNYMEHINEGTLKNRLNIVRRFLTRLYAGQYQTEITSIKAEEI